MMDANSQCEVVNFFEYAAKAHAKQIKKAPGIVRDAPVARMDFGSGWYHEAAIRDAKPDSPYVS